VVFENWYMLVSPLFFKIRWGSEREILFKKKWGNVVVTHDISFSYLKTLKICLSNNWYDQRLYTKKKSWYMPDSFSHDAILTWYMTLFSFFKHEDAICMSLCMLIQSKIKFNVTPVNATIKIKLHIRVQTRLAHSYKNFA
jgi:hypothetical protein